MSIKGVDPTCYILALFVRDDGERFLLGSGSYVFKGKQMHFQANTIQNDAVEVQGADGYLLAGQVRRPGSQDFDGYVGSGTASKTEVEANRRAFFSFFRKNYFYKVVYVFPNGTAIQRKRGFLVDDPTVKELYQVNPEYHVALNFEDVNYYSYSENDEGEEIYAKDAIIHLSAGASSGGLVWDEYGVVWDPITWSGSANASGSEFVILNNAGVRAPLIDTSYLGDTTQQTYSGKNLLPVPATNTLNNVTFTNNGDGTFNVVSNGAVSANTEFTVVVPLDGSGLVGGQKYTISSNEAIGTGDNKLDYFIHSVQQLGTWNKTLAALDSAKTFTLAEPTTGYIKYVIRARNGSTYNITNVKTQIEAGETATDWQPYTGVIPSPNPDYPQDVNVVTGEQTVTVTGKNLFNKNGSITNGNLTSSGSITGSTSNWRITDYIPIQPNTSYTTSGMTTGAGTNPSRCYYDKNKTFISGTKHGNANPFTETSPAGAYYLRDSFQVEDINTVQVQVGSTATTYEPYQSTTKTIDLGSIELAKIGNYQDYIYKSGDDWYVHKEIGKYTFTGSEAFSKSGYSTTAAWAMYWVTTSLGIDVSVDSGYCEFGEVRSLNNISYVNNGVVFNNNTGSTFVKLLKSMITNWDESATDSAKVELAKNMITGKSFYYALSIPTDTKITDADLIADLEAFLAMKLLLGENNFAVSATSTNLPAILDVDYFTEWGGGGAVWEEGGPAGPTIVEVDSIDTVYPIWQVTGPATNPQLTVLTTNTTIQYNGNITSSQILEIDMFNKTATLNGASVIGNVSGDWIQFAPGNNRVTYTADNADAPESKIMWQEIVG